MINYIKGFYSWMYSKKNLKYSIPLLVCYILAIYSPFFKAWIEENTYKADGRIKFKKKAKVNPFAEAIKEPMKDAEHISIDNLESYIEFVNK